MCWACSKYGKYITKLIGNSKGKDPVRRLRHKWGANIKMINLKKIEVVKLSLCLIN
jgi:hypothetical protein